MRIVIIVLIFLGGLPKKASAQQRDDWRACTDFDGIGAIAACTRLIDSDKLTSGERRKAFASRGFAHFGQDKHDLAIADYSEAIRLDPDDANAFRTRGIIYAEKGDLDHAIADLSEAIRLEPHSNFLESRGRVYELKGEHERAMADFNEVVRRNEVARRKPDYTDELFYGRVITQKDVYGRPIPVFHAAVCLNPDFDEPLYGQGFVAEEKRSGFAMVDFAEVILKSPVFARAVHDYCITCDGEGNLHAPLPSLAR